MSLTVRGVSCSLAGTAQESSSSNQTQSSLVQRLSGHLDKITREIEALQKEKRQLDASRVQIFTKKRKSEMSSEPLIEKSDSKEAFVKDQTAGCQVDPPFAKDLAKIQELELYRDIAASRFLNMIEPNKEKQPQKIIDLMLLYDEPALCPTFTTAEGNRRKEREERFRADPRQPLFCLTHISWTRKHFKDPVSLFFWNYAMKEGVIDLAESLIRLGVTCKMKREVRRAIQYNHTDLFFCLFKTHAWHFPPVDLVERSRYLQIAAAAGAVEIFRYCYGDGSWLEFDEKKERPVHFGAMKIIIKQIANNKQIEMFNIVRTPGNKAMQNWCDTTLCQVDSWLYWTYRRQLKS